MAKAYTPDTRACTHTPCAHANSTRMKRHARTDTDCVQCLAAARTLADCAFRENPPRAHTSMRTPAARTWEARSTFAFTVCWRLADALLHADPVPARHAIRHAIPATACCYGMLLYACHTLPATACYTTCNATCYAIRHARPHAIPAAGCTPSAPSRFFDAPSPRQTRVPHHCDCGAALWHHPSNLLRCLASSHLKGCPQDATRKQRYATCNTQCATCDMHKQTLKQNARHCATLYSKS